MITKEMIIEKGRIEEREKNKQGEKKECPEIIKGIVIFVLIAFLGNMQINDFFFDFSKADHLAVFLFLVGSIATWVFLYSKAAGKLTVKKIIYYSLSVIAGIILSFYFAGRGVI